MLFLTLKPNYTRRAQWDAPPPHFLLLLSGGIILMDLVSMMPESSCRVGKIITVTSQILMKETGSALPLNRQADQQVNDL